MGNPVKFLNNEVHYLDEEEKYLKEAMAQVDSEARDLLNEKNEIVRLEHMIEELRAKAEDFQQVFFETLGNKQFSSYDSSVDQLAKKFMEYHKEIIVLKDFFSKFQRGLDRHLSNKKKDYKLYSLIENSHNHLVHQYERFSKSMFGSVSHLNDINDLKNKFYNHHGRQINR